MQGIAEGKLRHVVSMCSGRQHWTLVTDKLCYTGFEHMHARHCRTCRLMAVWLQTCSDTGARGGWDIWLEWKMSGCLCRRCSAQWQAVELGAGQRRAGMTVWDGWWRKCKNQEQWKIII